MHVHTMLDEQMRVVVKMYWGDPREKVCDAVEELQMESLVMGSRGLGQIQRYAPRMQQFSDRACVFYLLHSMNLQDSAGKCDELRAVQCVMPRDRRQVQVVALAFHFQKDESAANLRKPKQLNPIYCTLRFSCFHSMICFIFLDVPGHCCFREKGCQINCQLVSLHEKVTGQHHYTISF
jgi:hypothetical protein